MGFDLGFENTISWEMGLGLPFATLFISLSEVQIYDLSYNHVLRLLLLVKRVETSLCCFVLVMKNRKVKKNSRFKFV